MVDRSGEGTPQARRGTPAVRVEDSAWTHPGLFQSLGHWSAAPWQPPLAQSEVEKDHLPVTSLSPQGSRSVFKAMWQACFKGPRGPAGLSLPRQPSPIRRWLLPEGCSGQFCQGLPGRVLWSHCDCPGQQGARYPSEYFFLRDLMGRWGREKGSGRSRKILVTMALQAFCKSALAWPGDGSLCEGEDSWKQAILARHPSRKGLQSPLGSLRAGGDSES